MKSILFALWFSAACAQTVRPADANSSDSNSRTDSRADVATDAVSDAAAEFCEIGATWCPLSGDVCLSVDACSMQNCAPGRTLVCGSERCDPLHQYCRSAPGGGTCIDLPSTCDRSIYCGCLAAEPCGASCFPLRVAGGGLTVTCPR